MPRKATFKARNTSADAPFTAKMAESYFGAIKSDSDSLRSNFNSLREEVRDLRKYMDKRFDEVDKRFSDVDFTLKSIFNIIHTYDLERKEIKVTLWEYDRRLIKLEA